MLLSYSLLLNTSTARHSVVDHSEVELYRIFRSNPADVTYSNTECSCLNFTNLNNSYLNNVKLHISSLMSLLSVKHGDWKAVIVSKVAAALSYLYLFKVHSSRTRLSELSPNHFSDNRVVNSSL